MVALRRQTPGALPHNRTRPRICGEGIARSAPTEGKIGLSALYDGLFLMNKPALRGINSVGDYTVACRNGNTPVKAGDKLGGARIVPLVTKRSTVEQAV